jgi:hypothetical protein
MSLAPAWLNLTVWPSIDASTVVAFRALNGILLLATILWALPQWRRFFVSERWGGYAESSRETDVLHRPVVAAAMLAVWFACAALLVVGRWTVAAAAVSVVIARHHCVRMRWRSVLRGMGAPGYMTYWLACAVFLTEYSSHHAPGLMPLALLVLQVDFAFIMLSAGIYKFTAGYPRNEGMELGMVNPEWGYWWRWFVRVPPGHLLFRTLNHLAWGTEVAAALLMLFPPTRLVGALLIMGSFVFILTQIRLGWLCEMVILCGLLFFHSGSAPAVALAHLVPTAAPAVVHPLPVPTALLTALLWAYLVLLPLAHAGLYFNFYAGKSLPGRLQRAFERYTLFWGLIIWRVFSVDVINFFIEVRVRERAGGPARMLTRYGIRHGLRFAHVCESITITTIFTSLKYYRSNQALFESRLLRYARTLGCPATAELVFDYVAVRKDKARFEHVKVAEFVVDPAAGTIIECSPSADTTRRAAALSPVREGVRPGSYVALGR